MTFSLVKLFIVVNLLIMEKPLWMNMFGPRTITMVGLSLKNTRLAVREYYISIKDGKVTH